MSTTNTKTKIHTYKNQLPTQQLAAKSPPHPPNTYR